VAKPKQIDLPEADISIPILYEDRSILALDKPPGWMLAPDSWENTGRNLQLALQSSLNGGDFWARSRNLKFLRYIHRLDADTSGVILFAKSQGALRSYTELFETRSVEKTYLAVVYGIPKAKEWTCNLALISDPRMKGRMLVVPKGKDELEAKDAETHFRVLETLKDKALIEARPSTGRTHQIRVHLAAAGHAVWGDPLYGAMKIEEKTRRVKLGLRAWRLAYRDPFERRRIFIEAPMEEFKRDYGFQVGRREGV